jgi:NADPH:quinone reductase-like Zn-dependent oxidoreductase
MKNHIEYRSGTRYGNVSKKGKRGGYAAIPAITIGRMAAGRKRDEGMTRRVEGKVALVTGAANGIGRSAALVLAREGAKLVATDLQDEKGEGLLRELRPWDACASTTTTT